jgi:sugar (pentulose or hexulose) kinase
MTRCKRRPGAEGLIFLPYISGERSPVWDENARGVFIGMSSAHTRAHLTRAVLEGICFALLDVLNAVEETTGIVEKILLKWWSHSIRSMGAAACKYYGEKNYRK